ncbi:MAG: hypothetical protein SPD98_08115 [Tractidigestivibacter sp.]|uniref:hypothetical protein n=1 Tax=Tractidigestivibacter sp. TaxID=2847320 RepID=UPI002A80C277|nr:hypothetical protein [Tractidigestivibacter sp.]MDY4535194.1 hypothetical protein [Tractidigestivibacter sp.]
MNARERFDAFLESGDRARECRRDRSASLWGVLFISCVIQFVSSTLASEMSYAQPTATRLWTPVALLLNLLISNAAFSFFIVSESDGEKSPSLRCPAHLMASTLPLQIAGALLIYLIQLALSIPASFAAMVSGRLGLLCSLAASIIATLLSATFVFVTIGNADAGHRGFRGLRCLRRCLSDTVAIAASSAKDVARPAAVLVVWNFIASCSMTPFVSWVVSDGSLPSVLSVTTLLHSGLLPGAIAYTLFSLVYYAVASWLEIDVVLGAALSFDGRKNRG